MRKRHLLCILFAPALLAGCMIVSLHPLYLEEDLLFDERLLGTWVGEDSSMRFERSGQKSYHFTLIEESEAAHFKLHLLRIGDHTFWDLSPWEEPSDDEFLLIPTHLPVKVSLEEEQLRMYLPDSDWLKKGLQSGDIEIGHIVMSDRVLLTAPTADMQALFLQQATNEKAFSEPQTFRRARQ